MLFQSLYNYYTILVSEIYTFGGMFTTLLKVNRTMLELVRSFEAKRSQAAALESLWY